MTVFTSCRGRQHFLWIICHLTTSSWMHLALLLQFFFFIAGQWSCSKPVICAQGSVYSSPVLSLSLLLSNHSDPCFTASQDAKFQ